MTRPFLLWACDGAEQCQCHMETVRGFEKHLQTLPCDPNQSKPLSAKVPDSVSLVNETTVKVSITDVVDLQIRDSPRAQRAGPSPNPGHAAINPSEVRRSKAGVRDPSDARAANTLV